MDQFEKRELLEEFLIRWHGGSSMHRICAELIAKGQNPQDVTTCRRIFEIWAKSRKPWSAIQKLEKKALAAR
jgi:hypothetical protein